MTRGDPVVDRKDEIDRALRYLRENAAIVVISGSRLIGKTFLANYISARLENAHVGPTRVRTLFVNLTNSCYTFYDYRRQIALLLNNPSLTQGSAQDFKSKLDSFINDEGHSELLILLDDFDLERFEPDTRNDEVNRFREFLHALPRKVRVLITTLDLPALETLLPLRSVKIELGDLPDRKFLQIIVNDTLDRKSFRVTDAERERITTELEAELGRHPGAIVSVLHHCTSIETLYSVLQSSDKGAASVLQRLYEVDWHKMPLSQKTLLSWFAQFGGLVSRHFIEQFLDSNTLNFTDLMTRFVGNRLLAFELNNDISYAKMPSPFRRFVLTQATNTDELTRRILVSFKLYMTKNWEDVETVRRDLPVVLKLFNWALLHSGREYVVELYNLILDPMFTLGLFGERIALGEQVLRLFPEVNCSPSLAVVFNSVISTGALVANFSFAHRVIEQFELRQPENDAVLGIRLRAKAYTLYREGRVVESIPIAEESYSVLLRAGDRLNAVDAVCIVVAAHLHMNNLKPAEQAIGQFRDLIESIPWARGRAYHLRDLAEVRFRQRRIPESKALLVAAKQIAESHQDIRQQVRIDLSRARVMLFTGNRKQALELLELIGRKAERFCLSGEAREANATYRAYGGLKRYWKCLIARPSPRFSPASIGGD